MRIVVYLAVLLHASLADAQVSLGSDPACDFQIADTGIQDLIDQGHAEIRVTNQVEHLVNLFIDRSLVLRGGYANCEDAGHNQTSGQKTTLDGNDFYSVVTIDLGDQDHEVSLHDLQLTGGDGSDVVHGGGLTITSDGVMDANVSLHGVNIINNRAPNGGGLYVTGRYIDVALHHSFILSNTASLNGGGLYCDYADVRLFAGSGISGNAANNANDLYGNGGGAFLTNHCAMAIQSGTEGGLFDFRGVSFNAASGHGGGVYVESEAELELNSAVMGRPVNVNNNVADSDGNQLGDGGGAYVVDPGSRILGYGGLWLDNQAAHGGGIAVVNEANVSITKTSADGCWNQKKCNVIENNTTTASGGDGGFLFLDDGRATVSFAQVNGNRADAGTILYAKNGGRAFITHSLFHANGKGGDAAWTDTYALYALNSFVYLSHVTLGHNHTHLATLGFTGANYGISNSIIYEPETGQMANFTNASGSMNCMVMDNSNNAGEVNFVSYEDPLFVDSVAGDLHLQQGSPAIDACDMPTPGRNLRMGIAVDIDNEAMGWDDPTKDNGLGTFDAGADESYAGDVIFESGFEPLL